MFTYFLLKKLNESKGNRALATVVTNLYVSYSYLYYYF